MKMHPLRCIVTLLSFVSFGITVTAQVGSYAITNAQIVTVSGNTISSGTVVIRNGLIEFVGSNIKVPADTKVFDGKGLSVYPGLFDASNALP